MSKDYKQYLTAIFLVAPKPTTFKIVLHNGQYFFMTYMGKKIAGTNETDSHVYEANIAGKRFYLDNIGIKERAMNAITRLLKFGAPLKTKGPEGAEESTRPEGENPTGGGEKTGGNEAPEETGAEQTGGEESLKEYIMHELFKPYQGSVNKVSILQLLLKEANTGGSTEAEKVLEILINLKQKIKNEASLKEFLRGNSPDSKFLTKYFNTYLGGNNISSLYFNGIQKLPVLNNAKNLGEGNFKTSLLWVNYGGIPSARSKTDIATDKVNYSVKNGETQVRVLDASAPQLKALINYCVDVLDYKKSIKQALEDQINQLEKTAKEEGSTLSRIYDGDGEKYGLGDLRKIIDKELQKLIFKFDKNTQDLNKIVDNIFQQAQKNPNFKRVFIEESLSGKGMFGKKSQGAADKILTFSLDFSKINTMSISNAAKKISESYSPPKFGTKSSGTRISKTVQQFYKSQPMKELYSLINEFNTILLVEDKLIKNKLLLEDNILQKGINYVKEKGSNILKKIIDFFINFINELKELAKISYEKALDHLGIKIYAEDVHYDASMTYNQLY
jgi:hypothetical protein